MINGIDGNYSYDLKKLLKYGAKDGTHKETGTIAFERPGMEILDETADFDQLVLGALMSATKKAKKPEDSDQESVKQEKNEVPTPKEIKMLFFSSDRKDVKIADLFSSFKKIMCLSADLGDGTKMTELLINKLDPNDFKDMMCGYASFFTFPSLLNEE